MLFLLFVSLISAEECQSCGNLIVGEAYNEGMANGIVTVTKKSGNPCSQYITCTQLDDTLDGIVQISINAFGHSQTVEFDLTMATLTIPCGTQQKYFMFGYPEFPLTNTIQCESTPGFGPPVSNTTKTPVAQNTTTTKTPTTRKPQCPEGGTWSAWSAATCNDTCGFCGVKVQTRQCTSTAAGCPCIGATSQSGARCGDSLCPFPRGSCCLQYSKRAIVGGQIKCILL